MQQSPSQPVNSGRWTAKEHVLFLEALKTHGQDWRRIAWDLKTRNNVQVRTHAQKYFKKLERMKRKAMLKQQQLSQSAAGSKTKPESRNKRTKLSSSESSEDEREEEDDVDDYEDGEFTESDTDTSDKGPHQKVRSSDNNNSNTDAASGAGQPGISRMISSDGTLKQTLIGFAPQNGPMMQQTYQMMMLPTHANGAPQLLGPTLTAYPSIFRPIISLPNSMMPQMTAAKPWPQAALQQQQMSTAQRGFPQGVNFNGQMMAAPQQQQQYQMANGLTGISGISAYGAHMLHTPARNHFNQ